MDRREDAVGTMPRPDPTADDDDLWRQLAAVRAANQTLQAERAELLAQLDRVQEQLAAHEEMSRALAALRDQYEELWQATVANREATDQVRLAAERLQAEAEVALEAAEGISPGGLAVARRLTLLAGHYPRAAAAAKRLLRVLLTLKRRVDRRR